ncbi:hypothetical protein A9Q75_05930 [Colwellia psychrerythraea]|uniref:Glycosyl transferase, WecB/TagA/CpsF family n=1 Tax=Colwellia psychrerythraea TaxID=28229 RepID=A0A1Y5EMU0_COLPS|nr:hypothetical protein A9Q75_05930 [Colwellia psychrerythraea]
MLSAEKFSDILQQKAEQTKIVSFINPFSYPLIAKSLNLIEEIDYWFVDGMALCHLSNLRRKNNLLRASFDLSSIARDCFDYASKKEVNVALVGASESEIKLACSNLKKLFPNLKIVYSHHGFIKNKFESVYEDIEESNANYLIVGMGTPMQEEFAIGCRKVCPSLSLILTCGGFLTQTAMKPDYYHPLIKKFGLRWLQRAYLHSYVRKRLIKDYPSFIIRYLFNR